MKNTDKKSYPFVLRWIFSLIICVAFIAAYYGIQFVLRQVSTLVLGPWLFLILTFASMSFALISYFIARKKNYIEKTESKITPISILISILAGIGCFELANAISVVLALLLPDKLENYTNQMATVTNGSIIATLITIVFLAPIGEEVLFRGIIFSTLRKTNHVVIAIILQALLFGAFHLNWIQGIYVIPLALMTGFVANKYKSVIPGIMYPFSFNFSSTCPIYISTSG